MQNSNYAENRRGTSQLSYDGFLKTKPMILLICLLGCLCMTGCKSKMEKTIEETLYQKYGEEFFVRSHNSHGGAYRVKCSPVAREDVIFDVRIEDDETPDESDTYVNAYLAAQLTEKLKEDLNQFFPGAYYYATAAIMTNKPIIDLKNKSVEDLLQNVNIEESELYLDIYYDEKIGTAQNYEEEYEYFTRTIDDYKAQNKAIPVLVIIHKVDAETICKLEEFYKNHDDYYINNYDRELFGNEGYVLGDCFEGNSDLGNPKHISACFMELAPTYLDDIDEYIRRRELLENER